MKQYALPEDYRIDSEVMNSHQRSSIGNYPSENIPKLKGEKGWTGETPVNLESGNFYPPHLTVFPFLQPGDMHDHDRG